MKKRYNDYMDNVSVDQKLHDKIIHQVNKKYKKRINFKYVFTGMCAAVILLLVVIVAPFGRLQLNPPPINQETLHPLIFNKFDELRTEQPLSYFAYDLDLTPEQIKAIFPNLGIEISATALYSRENHGLIVVYAGNDYVRINLREREYSHPFFRNGNELIQTTEIYGIQVTAFTYELGEHAQVSAEFKLGEVFYQIGLTDIEEVAKNRLTEIVNKIIAGGEIDLSILANPDLSGFRNDKVTLTEAYNDPDLGLFLPLNVPNRFVFEGGTRSANPNRGEEFLLTVWSRRHDSIWWTVVTATEYDRNNIVSVKDIHRYDISNYAIPLTDSVPMEKWKSMFEPVFRAEEITLDVVRARLNRNGGINFDVFYGDIVVRINTNGLTPEQVFGMLPDL